MIDPFSLRNPSCPGLLVVYSTEVRQEYARLTRFFARTTIESRAGQGLKVFSATLLLLLLELICLLLTCFLLLASFACCLCAIEP